MHSTPSTSELIFPAPYGRYVLLDKIGEGGMAEVFRAAVLGPAGFRRILVIKRILPSISQDQSFVDMFIDEANLCARLSHPNIVQIYDFGKVGDTYFIAMEYIMGCNVGSMMSKAVRTRRLPPPVVAADIAHQVCLGLDYAHTLKIGDRPLGIVHRDVSPTNIMVAYTGTAKVLDFGIARAAEGRETSTRSGMLKGKIAYLAPEQIHFGPLDRRADIFAAGIVLHEMLAGRRLFRASNDLQLMRMIAEMSIPPLAALNPEVKPELERIVMRALEKNPDRRYSSAAEMASDLEGYLMDERHSAWVVSHFLGDLFSEEISRTPTIEMSTDRLVGMMRAVTNKGFPAMDPAGSSMASAIIVDDLAAPPSAEGHGPEGHGPEGHGPEGHGPEGHGPKGRACDPLQPESRHMNSTIAIRPQMVSELFGPQIPETLSLDSQFSRSCDLPVVNPGVSEDSSEYLNLSLTKREFDVTVNRSLRGRRNKRLGRIVMAAGFTTALTGILLAVIYSAWGRHRPRSTETKTRAESSMLIPAQVEVSDSEIPDPRVSQVRIWINSVPSDAAIMRENMLVGTTPAAIYLPCGTEVVDLTVVRTGYATASVRVFPDISKSVPVALRPLRAWSLRFDGQRPEGQRALHSRRRTASQVESLSSQHPRGNIRGAIPVDPFSN